MATISTGKKEGLTPFVYDPVKEHKKVVRELDKVKNVLKVQGELLDRILNKVLKLEEKLK